MDVKKENTLMHIAFLGALLAGLLFVLVYFNIVSCGFYSSAGCDIYYSLIAGGKPKIMVISGDEGLGNPAFLVQILRSSKFGARVTHKELDVVSLPNLQENQLVIVEKAQEMSISELKMFQDYVNRGGKLVWIGDAGTRSSSENWADGNYFLRENQRKEGASGDYIGPWARREGDKQVALDVLLGVNFRANYCELAECKLPQYIGNFEFVDTEERIVYGLGQGLVFYSDFSVVKLNSDGYQTNLAFMNHGSDLIAEPPGDNFWLKGERINFGNEFPVIVSSGVGGRVVYYAFPPEYFVSENMPIDEKTGRRIAYWAMMENLYYGMLYK